VTNFNYPQKVAAMGRFLDDYGDFLKANGFTCTVAGNGIAWESFRQRHAAHAEFPGFVRDVAGLYTQHDAFVHFSDLDAFPYVVLEAQAAGLPVIVNRDCGMLEQVANGVNGYVVDLPIREDVEARLFALRDNPDLRRELGRRSRETVSQTYNLSAIGGTLRQILLRR
jgi:glycosyltransferase involved in cell wall biosynthesis